MDFWKNKKETASATLTTSPSPLSPKNALFTATVTPSETTAPDAPRATATAADEAVAKSAITASAEPETDAAAKTPATAPVVSETPPTVADAPVADALEDEKRTEFATLKAKYKADFKSILDELTPPRDDKRAVKIQISAIKSLRKRLTALLAVGIKPDAIFAATTKKGFSISREQFAKIIGEIVGKAGVKNAQSI
ncbi:hypothetical protein FACS1894107_17070 [Planctomycetales bacterium]|nr:hypothetical protein FACS1894107_17070 [Planctomycetales bacterium]GHV23802.1 hypothetical protein AGMMS49959_18140 [Planctomycetales bacterium]